MRDFCQPRMDVQSICSSAAADSATPSASSMSRGGATSVIAVGGSQHPLPFHCQPAVSTAQHYFSATHCPQNQLSNVAGDSSVSLVLNSFSRDLYGSQHALYGGSSSVALTTTNATSSVTPPATIPGGAAAAPSPYCCECSTAQNRCSTDLCPCFASRRMCDEHCESARLAQFKYLDTTAKQQLFLI